MPHDLAARIYEMLVEEEPGLLDGDVGANAKICGTLSVIFAMLLADLLIGHGREVYEGAKRDTFSRIESMVEEEVARRERPKAATGSRH